MTSDIPPSLCYSIKNYLYPNSQQYFIEFGQSYFYIAAK